VTLNKFRTLRNPRAERIVANFAHTSARREGHPITQIVVFMKFHLCIKVIQRDFAWVLRLV